MKLDTPTIVIVSILTDFFLVLILFHAWYTRTTYRGFRIWLAATACWTLGSALSLVLFDLQPQFIPKIIGNGLIMLHPLLLFDGISDFHGFRQRWWGKPLNYTLVFAAMLWLGYHLYAVDDLLARTAAINAVLAILFARTSIEPLLQRKSRQYSMQWLLSVSLLPLVVMLVLRAWYYWICPSAMTIAEVLANDGLLRWTLFYGIVVELVIAYSYLSLTSDRVEEELRQSEKSLKDLSGSLQERVEEETRRRVSQERLLANHSRLAAMGQMISAIAHQWRQPLSTLSMIVQDFHASAREGAPSPAEWDDFKADAMAQIRHMSQTIEEFRNFQRPDRKREWFPAARCVEEALRLSSAQFNEHGIGQELRLPSGRLPGCFGYPSQLTQVLLTLLVNAKEAIEESRIRHHGRPETGRVVVELASLGDRLQITVSDNGGGVPEAQRERLFEPHTTSKEEQGGSGLGLYIAKMLVETGFGGKISYADLPDGACFAIELPASPEELS